ncbi:DUF6879 family protein, partial [Micromonospora sp. NPDC050695]|uniref:DUF6879 family protein n=1 Tax=Micromonospora sp. NPDC050695 TaxID=3154938 RepID=UPI00340ED18D
AATKPEHAGSTNAPDSTETMPWPTSKWRLPYYDADGVLASARRWRDPDLVASCQSFIESLYQGGEPLDEFFARAVAPTGPPRSG